MPGIPAAALSDDVLVRYEHPQLLSKKEVRSTHANATAAAAAAAGAAGGGAAGGGAGDPLCAEKGMAA